MIAAVGTSVLIEIDQGEADAGDWIDLLAEARAQGAFEDTPWSAALTCDV